MTLDMARKGQKVKILDISSDVVRAQAIRFGISEGEAVVLEEIIPSGPIIVSKNRQEIAIGRRLAQNILVEAV